MKKCLSLLLVFILALSLVSFSACGGGDENEETPTPSAAEPAETPEEEPVKVSSTGELSWKDMPVYSGAKQIQKGSWSIPAADGDYSKVEWRYYESKHSPETISAFYKDKMPDNDWEEMGWMEVADMSWGLFNKNNENDAAMVWVALDDGNSVIAMMRATK